MGVGSAVTEIRLVVQTGSASFWFRALKQTVCGEPQDKTKQKMLYYGGRLVKIPNYFSLCSVKHRVFCLPWNISSHIYTDAVCVRPAEVRHASINVGWLELILKPFWHSLSLVVIYKCLKEGGGFSLVCHTPLRCEERWFQLHLVGFWCYYRLHVSFCLKSTTWNSDLP